MKICKIPNCLNPYKAKDFCDIHYRRWLKYKNPYFRKCKANGEGHIDQFGYKKVYDNGKQVREHILIMEKHLGRKLLPFPKEIVHHIDGNKLNNDIKNLEICHQSDHVINHLKKSFIKDGKRNCCQCNETYSLDMFYRDNTSKALYKPYCKNCQKKYQNKHQ